MNKRRIRFGAIQNSYFTFLPALSLLQFVCLCAVVQSQHPLNHFIHFVFSSVHHPPHPPLPLPPPLLEKFELFEPNFHRLRPYFKKKSP